MTQAVQGTFVPAVFNFQSYYVRTIMRGDEPWFVAADVCAALGYRNTSKAISDHLDADEQSNVSLDSGGKPALIINESGLYALVLRSRKPEARKFAKWVTSEVLPSIRKTGRFDIKKSIDVKGLLLSGNSTPTIPLTPEVEGALKKKAFSMAGEAFFLIEEHLRRAVAHNCEYGQPRHLLVEKALQVIDQTTLGEALAHEYFKALNSCKTRLWLAKTKASEAIKSIEDLHIVAQANPLNGKGSQ